MNTAESLETYGTVAFAAEVIAENIFVGPQGRLDVSRWWSIVPEAYRQDAETSLARVFPLFRGEKPRGDFAARFAAVLSADILASVEWRAPRGSRRAT